MKLKKKNNLENLLKQIQQKTINKKTQEHLDHFQNQLKIQQKHYKRSKTSL